MKKNKKIVIGLFLLFVCLLGLTVYTSFSTLLQEDEIVIKSMTPVYDETSGVLVDQSSVIFNDKNQVVKYDVVLENTQDYDVKISNISLSTTTEEFLDYKVEGISKDDVVSANSTKELTVSFETMRIDGWGRNFSDELTANISFEKDVKQEEVTTPEEDKEEEKDTPQDTTSKEENDTIKPSTDSNNKEDKAENPYTSDNGIVIVLGVATCITGIAIIVLCNKKVAKYTVFIIMLTPMFTITNAEEVIEVSIKNNVSFESQNIMSKAYKLEQECGYVNEEAGIDEDGELVYEERYVCENEVVFQSYWEYRNKIKNVYIQNEINEIPEYVYKFDVTEEQNGRVTAYLVSDENEDLGDYELYIQADGIIYPNEDASYYFSDMLFAISIDNLAGMDTSNVTNMSNMFSRTGYMSLNFTLDVSSFNTSNVTNMSEMFSSTGNCSEEFTLDVSNFDTSNVTDMSGMFSDTGNNSEEFVLDVSNFNTSNVTDMSYMFSGLGERCINFSLDLSNFDTSNVTDMSYMFADAAEFSESLSLNLSNFDTSKVKDMTRMFSNTGSRVLNLTLNLNSFDTRNVVSMSEMFFETGYSSETLKLDLSSFNTSSVTDMSSMFSETGYSSETFDLDISHFDTSKVTDMSYMFYRTGYNSTKLNMSITIRNSKTYHYSSMFSGTAIKEGSQITVNYTFEAKDFIDRIIDTKSSNSNVVKGELMADVDNLSVGNEIHISNEKFNVISQTDNTLTLLAQYNLSTNSKQTTIKYGMQFSDTAEWEAESGPKEIDIQTWSTNPKTYINSYIEYIKEELSDDSVTGDLITLNELESLGCTISKDYSYKGDRNCDDSPYYQWLVNNSGWWTKSALSNHTTGIWFVGSYGALYGNDYHYTRGGIRPVITISKSALENYLKAYY